MTRSEAIYRLIAYWVSRAVEEGESFTSRIRLRDFVHPDVVDQVIAGNLLARFSARQRQQLLIEIDAETERQQQLIRAWAQPDSGVRQ
jgi:hypothetical protein